jgi:hypothetical protein
MQFAIHVVLIINHSSWFRSTQYSSPQWLLYRLEHGIVVAYQGQSGVCWLLILTHSSGSVAVLHQNNDTTPGRCRPCSHRCDHIIGLPRSFRVALDYCFLGMPIPRWSCNIRYSSVRFPEIPIFLGKTINPNGRLPYCRMLEASLWISHRPEFIALSQYAYYIISIATTLKGWEKQLAFYIHWTCSLIRRTTCFTDDKPEQVEPH